MKAMILAAGYGTRLWPLTADRTKPAIPFLGRPLVGYVAEYLARFGCREVVVNLHHMGESVRSSLGDGTRFGVRVSYIEEPEILGTSGALDNAKALLEGERIIVINGKIVTDIDLFAALETHERAGALATLVLRENRGREKFSTVIVEENLIKGFGPAPAAGNTGQVPLMFTGIQILEPEIFSYIPKGVFSHSTTDVYPVAIERGEKVVAHIAEGNWYELSTIKRYLDISLEVAARSNMGLISGEDPSIEAGAEVIDSILWDNVTVERGGRVIRSIIGDGVKVTSGESFENVAVVRAEVVQGQEVPEKAQQGEVFGENFVVPIA
jgi:NDP-sugar pyrophosphorylase family protein